MTTSLPPPPTQSRVESLPLTPPSTPSRPSTTSSREGGRTLDSRLSTLDLVAAIGLVVLAVGLAGCGGGEPPAPTASRFEAVQATAAPAALERWCDVYTPGAGAPRLELPQVAPARAGSPAFTLPADRWVWLNLWATWCVPCKREMPLLVKWRDQLVRDGVPFELVFLSVDDTAEGLARFFGEHPLVAPDPSLRLLQPKSLDAWLKRYEPEPSGAVPVHLIAAPGGAVRCVRAGAIRDGDYATVRALMR